MVQPVPHTGGHEAYRGPFFLIIRIKRISLPWWVPLAQCNTHSLDSGWALLFFDTHFTQKQCPLTHIGPLLWCTVLHNLTLPVLCPAANRESMVSQLATAVPTTPLPLRRLLSALSYGREPEPRLPPQKPCSSHTIILNQSGRRVIFLLKGYERRLVGKWSFDCPDPLLIFICDNLHTDWRNEVIASLRCRVHSFILCRPIILFFLCLLTI